MRATADANSSTAGPFTSSGVGIGAENAFGRCVAEAATRSRLVSVAILQLHPRRNGFLWFSMLL